MLRKEMRDFYPKNVSNSSVVVDQNKKSASFSPIGRKIPLKWKLSHDNSKFSCKMSIFWPMGKKHDDFFFDKCQR